MDSGLCSSEKQRGSEEEAEIDQLRKGPWTVEEDLALMNYIAIHGEGRWNALAHCAGLKRTGKSCRLRWLNYLHPDVRRGNITPEEQLLILELHSRWGNRWSQIAKHLPGRTDNEIKNFWRTRVKKQAKKLRCEINSQQFKDTVRNIWVPHLLQRIRAANAAAILSHHPITSSNVAGPLEEEPAISFVSEVQQHIHAGGGPTVTANSISTNATESYESDGAASRVASLMESDLDNDGKHGIMTTRLRASSQCQDDHIDVAGGADECWVGDADDGFYDAAGSDVYRGEIPAWGIDGEAYQGDYAWSSIDEVWFNWQHQFPSDGF